MKKVIIIVFTLCALFLTTNVGHGETYYKLTDVQTRIYDLTPRQLTVYDICAELTGTVAELISAGEWNIMRVETDEGRSAIMLGYDAPCFLCYQSIDCAVGDRVRVYGSINPMYSSYLVPYIGSPTVTVIN